MTVSTNPTRADYDGNGTATTFPYAFPVSSPTDIKVWQLVTTNPLDAVQTLLTLDVDYSVTMLTASSGYVTRLSGALPADYHWTIILDLTYEQPTSIKNQGQFYEDVHEAAFDRNVLLTKQVSELIGRTITLPVTLTDVTTEIDNLIDGAAFGLVSKPGGGWQVTMVANSGAQQTADLANTTNAAKNAGMVAFNYSLAYAPGTVGKALKDLIDADTAMDVRMDALEGNEEPVGQCRLVYTNPATLTLNRLNGRFLTINGVRKVIPAGGITLSSSGLTASTLYYVYAYMNGSTITLEASTTGHTRDSTTGVEIKSGDATRTLVGMVWVDTGPVFTWTAARKMVASWFNREKVSVTGHTTADRTSVSVNPTYTEYNPEARVEMVVWAYFMDFGICGGHKTAASSYTGFTVVCMDVGTASGVSTEAFVGVTAPATAGAYGSAPVTEGRHWWSLSGAVSSAGTVTLLGYSRVHASAFI